MQPEPHGEPQSSVTPEMGMARDPSRLRMWKLCLFFTAMIAILATAGTLLPGFISSQETGRQLTHTIGRGDLLVTVTEQGTLESSNNTEIKCKVRGQSTVTWVIESGTVVKPGDELVRLDTKVIEETLSLQKTNVHIATATLAETQASVAAARIGVQAYLEGRYRTQYKALQKELAIAETNLRSAKKMLEHSELLFKRGYVTELELDGNAFTVQQAELELNVKKTELDVLERYTKKMQLVSLNGRVTSLGSKLKADLAGLKMDTYRRNRAEEELAACVVRAEKGGLVIYPSAAQWKDAPEITEGGSVYKDQVMLLMPDLSKMQVKVGVHESIIERIKPGLPARITLPDMSLEAEVTTVAAVTKPAGWWTGNVVKYDTIIELPSESGLKPGMSAEVEIIMAKHENVLKIPVAAVVETEKGDLCWVKTDAGVQRRLLKLGDTNEVFIVVLAGVKEGDEVVLNPQAITEEAKSEALKSPEDAYLPDANSPDTRLPGNKLDSIPPAPMETDRGK